MKLLKTKSTLSFGFLNPWPFSALFWYVWKFWKPSQIYLLVFQRHGLFWHFLGCLKCLKAKSTISFGFSKICPFVSTFLVCLQVLKTKSTIWFSTCMAFFSIFLCVLNFEIQINNIFWYYEYMAFFGTFLVCLNFLKTKTNYFFWFAEYMAFFGTFSVCMKFSKAKSTICFGFPNTWPLSALFWCVWNFWKPRQLFLLIFWINYLFRNFFGVSEIFESQINYQLFWCVIKF